MGAGHAHRRPGPRGQRPQRQSSTSSSTRRSAGCSPPSPPGAGPTTSTSSSPPTTASSRATSGCCSRARTTSTALMRLPLIWRPAPSRRRRPRPTRHDARSGSSTSPPRSARSPASPRPPWMEGQPLPVDDADADARGFERVLTEWDSELLGVGVHLRTITRDGWVCTTYLPGHRARRHRGRALRPGRRPAAAGEPLGRPGGALRSATTWSPTCTASLRPARTPAPPGRRPGVTAALAPVVARRGRRSTSAQVPATQHPGLGLSAGESLSVTHRDRPRYDDGGAARPGEVYVLRHGPGDDAPCVVEQIDPMTLEVVRQSPDLAVGRCGRAGWRPTPTVAARRVRQPRPPACGRPLGARQSPSCRASARTTASSRCPTATSSPRTSAARRPGQPDGPRRRASWWCSTRRRWRSSLASVLPRAIDRPALS